ncbi:Tautomerase enzyme [Abditibacterium utsteinense]|uniref:Tautomerase enzyme n=1 Tax=Abditibacterium utsteinense TaxID=1960156 RepID=A0A2S8SVZ6_9BACT|nr:tautomerase family protein [Abditibacterium utsteinense]PQV64965.1 Tautomerase enzyme [Abditibacterium utsteinense]
MSQIKIYALKSALENKKPQVSEAIHAAVMQHLALPPEKRFHRFIALEREDFVFPSDRSENYLILEISMFEGRALETKKSLIRALFANLGALGFAAQDVEITIFETPRANWGIRGLCGDELGLSYKVEV